MGSGSETAQLRLIVGLGNPGSEYSGTRHNVGFQVVEELVKRWQPGAAQIKFGAELRDVVRSGRRILLAMPQTFMNRSGESVQQIVRFYQIPPEEVLVICDDLDLPPGQIRWRPSGSSGGQKGLADIVSRLGVETVPRLRVGIGRPPGRQEVVSWVLGRYRPDELQVAQTAVALAADSVEFCIAEGIVPTMNRYNRSVNC
jgi:PTH1 family peptidyl-tRNA hydrolase